MSVINKFYSDLEVKSDFDVLNVAIDLQKATEEENEIIQMENIAFFPISVFQDKNRNRQIDIKLVEYYDQRIQSTNNIYLLARYSHILYCLTHQPKWCNVSIKFYKKIINDNFTNEDKAFFTTELIGYLIQFSVEQKNNREEIKNDVLNYLKNGNRFIVIYLGDLLREQYNNYFKISEIQFLPERCYQYAIYENEYGICKRLVEIGLSYAKKDAKCFKVLISKFYELLGDNEQKEVKVYDNISENIVIPHQNQATYKQMMEYYDKAGNQKKYDYAARLYEDNKKNLRYLNITCQVPQDSNVTEFLHKHFDNLKNISPSMICLYLCLGDPYIFVPNQNLEKTAKGMKEHQLFKQCVRDLNQNEKEVDDYEWNKTMLYDTMLNNNFKYLANVILCSIESHKLTYNELKKFLLNHTCFGSKLNVQRGYTTISYTWFNQIDYALKDIFHQFASIIKQGKVDFRIPIDILSIKFEGILRDIIELTGGSITRIKDKGDTSSGLLEFLFKKQNDLFDAGFDIDDLNLFKYVHTDKGLNIRNNVAHSFYKPQDYTFKNAVLVFLCVLRLAKAKLKYEKKNSTI